MLQALSESLKSPLNYCGEAILGRCYLTEEPQDAYLVILIKKVCTVALVIIFSIGAITTTPFWFVGDLIEMVDQGNAPFKEPKYPTPKDPDSLDPKTTEYFGSSLSTYQNTSDSEFCKNSDWGRYVENHKEDKDFIPPGLGVDILTDDGLAQLITSTLEMNGNTRRFSVEWADIRNEDGSFNDVAMEQYVHVAKTLKEAGIIPIVSLHHFVTPLDKNGQMLFETPEGVEQYLEFATYVYEHLSDHVDHYVTFNELHVNAVENYIRGVFPAGGIANFYTYTQVTRRKLEAHAQVHKKLHEMAEESGKSIQVGLTHQPIMMATTSRWNYLARIVAFVFTYLFHNAFMNWAKENTSSLDLLGVQFYTTPLISGVIPDSTCREGQKMVEPMHFRFYPQGIYLVLQDIHTKLGDKVPLMFTETGTAGENDVEGDVDDEMDQRREEYFDESTKMVRAAQDSGINVVGYLVWSLFRNFEWPFGCSKDHDFGIVARDPETRKIRHTAGYHKLTQVFRNTREESARQQRRRAARTH